MEPKNPDQLKRRERLIQLAGILLMLSPICNFLLSVYFLDSMNEKWSLEGLTIILKNSSSSHLILWFSSFCVGAFMLKGRRSSWMPVLAVLGVFIVFNFWNLKKDLQRSTVRPFILLLTNVSIFALVYSQEFHQSSQPRLRKKSDSNSVADAASPAKNTTLPREQVPANFVLNHDTEKTSPEQVKIKDLAAKSSDQKETAKAKKKPRYTDYEVHVSDLLNKVVEFEGFGPWARITEANLTELHMEAMGASPPDIQNRRVEIILRDNKVLKLKMARQSGPKFIFVYRDLAQKSA